MSDVDFQSFWLMLPGPGPKPLDGCISLKLFLGTRLESESFEPFIVFLAFLEVETTNLLII